LLQEYKTNYFLAIAVVVVVVKIEIKFKFYFKVFFSLFALQVCAFVYFRISILCGSSEFNQANKRENQNFNHKFRIKKYL